MVSPGGRVRATATRRPVGEGVFSTLLAGVGAPIVQEPGGQVGVVGHGRVIWRSGGRFRAIGVFALAVPGAVAFTYESFTKRGERSSLYVARLGGSERRVAMGEQLLGWTASGELLTVRFERGVYLRDSSGRLLRRVSGRLRQVEFDQATRSLLAISRHGVLERYRNGYWSAIAKLPTFGLDRHTTFEQLTGDLIGLLDDHRVAVLRADGSLFASARFRSGNVAGESGLIANRAGTAVAFVVSHGSAAQPHGSESVVMLQAHDRRARTLYSGSVPGKLCVRWATLAWHGEWLLYSVTSGKTLALNSRSRGHPLDLTAIVYALAPDGPRSIDWV